MECRVCGHRGEPRLLAARDADAGTESFTIVLCTRCGAGRLDPPPADAVLERYYAGDYYGRGARKFVRPLQYLFDLGKTMLAASIRRAIPRASPAPVLDIGCGDGRLVLALGRAGVRAMGLERAGGAGRAMDDGIEVVEGGLDHPRLAGLEFSAVVLWHVLEHLPEPERVLAEVAARLQAGGLLFLAVPNAGSWQARLFGRHWFHLDLPRHLHFLPHRALGDLLARHGFAVQRRSTVQLSQNLYGFVQSALNALFPARPNRLYRLLRGTRGARENLELGLWLLPAAALLPLALLETLLAAAFGAGATSIHVARKGAR